MSVNSSYFDDPLHSPSPDSPNNSSSHFPYPCLWFKTMFYVFSAGAILYTLLLLPLIILVLYLGYQKSRKQHSSSTATSHSDHITYHSIFMQLIELLGIALYFFSIYFDHWEMVFVGLSVFNVTSVGQALFHLLTCVERYLAVVHPLTYLGLRQGGGVRIRNISIGCAWFLALVDLAVFFLANLESYETWYYCIMCLLLSGVTFCSVSVLYVLKRPGPGEGGGTRERVDQSKQRAFYTIMAIMGVLLLRFGGNLISYAMIGSTVLSISTVCVVEMSLFWFGLPSGLVLPLLFLKGAGKLQCCKQNTESG